jgi:hypothetical protein
MKFVTRHSKSIAIVLCLTLITQLTACGTLLYPERRGQEGGKVDPLVAVLDGVGLLFFLIPGIIAFGVDIGTGAIYLPPGGRSEAPPAEDGQAVEEPARIVYLDPASITPEAIEAAILAETGFQISLADPDTQATRQDSIRLLTQQIAATNFSLQNSYRAAAAPALAN